MDNTGGCQLYLSKDSLGASITTAKSSEINVLVPGAEPGGDLVCFQLLDLFLLCLTTKILFVAVVYVAFLVFLFGLGGGRNAQIHLSLNSQLKSQSNPFCCTFEDFCFVISLEMAYHVFICRRSMLCHSSSFMHSRMASLKPLPSPTLEGNGSSSCCRCWFLLFYFIYLISWMARGRFNAFFFPFDSI